MTSHGQRFRRRALRRGYKVDEVDAFLERVEATVAGEPIDVPVTAQEVRDVVFRGRFGGYDEWQVDLHLDRVERQLSEAATQAAPPDPFAAARPAGGPPPLVPRPAPESGFGAYDQTYGGGDQTYGGGDQTYGGGDQTYAGEPAAYSGFGADRFQSDMTTEMRLGDPAPPRGPESPAERTGVQPIVPVPGGPSPHQPPAGPHGGPPHSGPPQLASPPVGPGGPPYGGGEYGGPGYPAPEYPAPPYGGREYDGPAYPPAGPDGPAYPPASGGPGGPGMPPASGGLGAGASYEAQRVDQLRRSFQPRRFGSGYDRAQVDQLFEGLLAGLSGRGPMPATEAQLDPRQFDLVSGGYFEAEVDQALQEVREILRRQ